MTGAFLPPASVLLAYWMGGAFLMAIKRYSEYRGIADPARAALYRRSFAFYSEQSLLLSGFFYALLSACFTGVFLIKYRIEFLLVLPRTNIEQARLCAERIRRMTEELAFPDFDRSFSITSSFGIAQYRPGEDLKDMLSRADTALYKAKHAGRNRVESAELELVA